MSVLKKAREHLMGLLVLAAYAALFILRPDMGISSLNNSAYYIREMLTIMPVILVLTALMDLWIPRDKILKYLGKESKARGAVLSLVLGSVSAGPVYAAFPLCVMLHKKGASIRNLTIILSAWAVIKVPMLLNELKFLGMKFMAVRWVLTVASIFVFAWMTAKIVKDGDIPKEKAAPKSLTIHREACMGCARCAKTCPELFEMKNRKASLRAVDAEPDRLRLLEAIEACPVRAIALRDEGNSIGEEAREMPETGEAGRGERAARPETRPR